MENIILENKSKINGYQPSPIRLYDVEGTMVEKNGKNVKIEKKINNKVIEYSLRLKAEIDGKIGENVKVEKENILSSKTEEKEEIEEASEETRNVAAILRELGLEYTKENIRMIEQLMGTGTVITKNSVDSYIKTRENLSQIIENIDPGSLVKLIDKGIDLEEDNLQNISEALELMKNEKEPFSIKKFLKIEKDLDYKDAEEIAKEIYGQRMGKDVYDTIIALDKEEIAINKENINKTTEAMAKLYDLKDLENESYVKVLTNDESFTINNLFKIKNDYTRSNIEKNDSSNIFESFTIAKEVNIDSLKEMLRNLNIEENTDHISILREFIVSDMDMNRESFDKIISMKNDLSELRSLLDHENMAKIMDNDLDPLEENIHNLVEVLKNKRKTESTVEETLSEEKTKEILSQLEKLGEIKDEDLLKLLKAGQDFNIKSIKEIKNTNIDKELSLEYKLVEKTNYLTNIMNTLGEELNRQTISLASRRYDNISLENLYKSQNEVKENQQRIASIDKGQEDFIFNEYVKIRNTLSTNMIKESIKEGKAIETMALNEVNVYMEKKLNRYKEISEIAKEIGNIKGKEDSVLPIIMKNDLPMTLKEIKNINEFLNGEKAMTHLLKAIENEKSGKYTDEFKEAIKILQEKVSESIKNNDKNIKENYKDLVDLIESQGNSFKDRQNQEKHENPEKNYLDLQEKISKKDMVLQFPIKSGKEYKDLNLIIPNMDKAIDKNNMNFIVSLETENLGQVTLDLKVIGKQVEIDLKEYGHGLKNNIGFLENSLEKLGYTSKLKVDDVEI